MFKTTILAASLSLTTGIVHAHPGSNILTTGSKAPRTAMTTGVSYEEAHGVHVFRGATKLAGEEPVLAASAEKRAAPSQTIIYKGVWRSFRSLRTQGFYSGRRPNSRRYTQGFYSGG